MTRPDAAARRSPHHVSSRRPADHHGAATSPTPTEVTAEYERWSYGEGYQAGRVEGGRDGWRDGYRYGFDSGAEVGGHRVLLELENVIGRERLQELVRDADNHIPHVQGYLDYRARTAYEPPARAAEYRGGPVEWEPAKTVADDGDDDTDCL